MSRRDIYFFGMAAVLTNGHTANYDISVRIVPIVPATE